MPELTPQDKESYKKLYSAATDLNKAISNATVITNDPKLKPKAEAGLPILKSLTSTFFDNLPRPNVLASFEQLQAQIDLTGGYLTMYQLFTEAINQSSQKDAVNEANQKLLLSYNQLQVSLEAADDDLLDDLTTSCPDPLFLSLLTDSNQSKVKSWTQQFLNDQAPTLTDSQVQVLINAWGTAVTKFVEDARAKNDGGQVKPGNAETIAHFFCIHDQLEALYSELSTAVALNN